MPQIEICPATSQDLEKLADLDHSYQTAFVWQMDRSLDGGQISTFFREIQLPRSVRVEYPHTATRLLETLPQAVVLVALYKSNLVGYVSVKEQVIPQSAWISDLMVVEKLRRQGIGTALVLAAQDWAMNNNLTRIFLEMQSKNYPAIRFAMKIGFEFCGYNDHYYTNQDIALFFTRTQR
ncbi:MAG: GNAT family N-acetyltransferase [Anaerolineaceae bacterium]|jgi:ribosomal protein S18 acetylase RimI-like enzyme